MLIVMRVMLYLWEGNNIPLPYLPVIRLYRKIDKYGVGVFKNSRCIDVFYPCDENFFWEHFCTNLGFEIIQKWSNYTVLWVKPPKNIHWGINKEGIYLCLNGQKLMKFKKKQLYMIFDSEMALQCLACTKPNKYQQQFDEKFCQM